jgi:hypothetical protein
MTSFFRDVLASTRTSGFFVRAPDGRVYAIQQVPG